MSLQHLLTPLSVCTLSQLYLFQTSHLCPALTTDAHSHCHEVLLNSYSFKAHMVTAEGMCGGNLGSKAQLTDPCLARVINIAGLG